MAALHCEPCWSRNGSRLSGGMFSTVQAGATELKALGVSGGERGSTSLELSTGRLTHLGPEIGTCTLG